MRPKWSLITLDEAEVEEEGWREQEEHSRPTCMKVSSWERARQSLETKRSQGGGGGGEDRERGAISDLAIGAHRVHIKTPQFYKQPGNLVGCWRKANMQGSGHLRMRPSLEISFDDSEYFSGGYYPLYTGCWRRHYEEHLAGKGIMRAPVVTVGFCSGWLAFVRHLKILMGENPASLTCAEPRTRPTESESLLVEPLKKPCDILEAGRACDFKNRRESGANSDPETLPFELVVI